MSIFVKKQQMINDDLNILCKVVVNVNMVVALNEIIDALEFINDGLDTSAYFNPKTGEIIYISDYTNEFDEEQLEEIYETWLSLPSKYMIDEYSMMECFIQTINDEILYNQLWIAIDGKGAFRRFKDTCINFDVIDDWYQFRDEKYRKLAVEWCRANDIKFEVK